jgi:hypothetical protein
MELPRVGVTALTRLLTVAGTAENCFATNAFIACVGEAANSFAFAPCAAIP